jgi:hypothetical protein
MRSFRQRTSNWARTCSVRRSSCAMWAVSQAARALRSATVQIRNPVALRVSLRWALAVRLVKS